MITKIGFKKRGVVKGKFTVFVKYVLTLQDVEISESQKIILEDRCRNIMTLLEQFSTIQDDIEFHLQDSELDLEKQLVKKRNLRKSILLDYLKGEMHAKDDNY